MKVLHVTNAFPSQDAPIYGVFVAEQVQSLLDRGIDADVLFINARKGGTLQYALAPPRLRRAARDVDIIHYHHVYTGLVGTASGLRQPSVISFMSDGIHQFKSWIPSALRSRLLALLHARTDAQIYKTPVPSMRGHDSNAVFLPNGIDLDRFSPIDRSLARRKLGWPEEGPYVLFVSANRGDRPEKRYPLFRQTTALLERKHGWHGLRTVAMVDEARERVPLIFNACDLHLLTSSREGSPNSVKEALATNTPVVGTDVGSVRDLLDGMPGCAVSSSDRPEALASLCDAALRRARPETRARLRERRLDRQSVAADLEALYRSLLERADCNRSRGARR